MLLAGDIGGTKTNLAIFSSQDELRTPLREGTYPSVRYSSLEELVRAFLSEADVPIERACFGVPGPVIEGKAKITNLPWAVDEQQLQHSLNIPVVCLLNDLGAMAHAIPLLDEIDLYTINAGSAESRGALAVIAPGTGLGEAFLTWQNARYDAYPSEGGHADFAPTNTREIDLLRYLLDRFEHVSYELVCAGIAIPHIYAYLQQTTHIEEQSVVTRKLAQAEDTNLVVFQHALLKEDPSPLCVATLKMFTAILGAEAGNLALKVLATGGVYLGGGIPARILPFLKEQAFMDAFCNKGRLSSVLTRVPVHVILNPKVPLIGAANYGFAL